MWNIVNLLDAADTFTGSSEEKLNDLLKTYFYDISFPR